MLYYVINETDCLMTTSRRWANESIRWTPLHTRLYYRVLFYIQTLRSMVSCHIIPSDAWKFLNYFLKSYPPEFLPIAGHLLPFFQSLCSREAPVAGYGAICPALGNTTNLNASQNGALPLETRVYLPNIWGIREGIHTTRLTPTGGNPMMWDRHFGNVASCAEEVLFGPDAENHLARDARVMPGTIHCIPMNDSSLKRYAGYFGHIDIPKSPPISADLTWSSYLGFDDGLYWFGQLIGQMQRYCQFFNDSSTLASCSPKKGPADIVVVTQEMAYPNRNDHREYDVNAVNLSGSAETRHFPMNVNPRMAMLDMFTKVNWIPGKNFHPSSDVLPGLSEVRSGPLWEILLTSSKSSKYSPQARVPQLILSSYFKN